MPKSLRRKARRVHLTTIIVASVLAIGMSTLAYQYRTHQAAISYSRQLIEAVHLLGLQLSEMAIDEKAILIGNSYTRLNTLQDHSRMVQNRSNELISIAEENVFHRQNARAIKTQLDELQKNLSIIFDSNQDLQKVMNEFENRGIVVAHVLELARASEKLARSEIVFHEKEISAVEMILMIVFVAAILFTFTLTLWGAGLYERYAEIRESSNSTMEEINRDLENRVVERTSELENAIAELQRSNADLERVIYSASHDLQEPIRLVSGYTSLLSRKYGSRLDETADQYIRYTVNNAQRMQDLMNDLLNFSSIHLEPTHFANTLLNSPVSKAVQYLEIMIEENEASIEVGDLGSAVVDENQIERVFRGLISNAIKFRHPERPLHIRVESNVDKSECTVSIIDNGIGFDQQYAEAIFELFARLHPRGRFPGTGIGLAIARKIVEIHNGKIWVESTPDIGSKFSFTLPIDDSESHLSIDRARQS